MLQCQTFSKTCSDCSCFLDTTTTATTTTTPPPATTTTTTGLITRIPKIDIYSRTVLDYPKRALDRKVLDSIIPFFYHIMLSNNHINYY